MKDQTKEKMRDGLGFIIVLGIIDISYIGAILWYVITHTVVFDFETWIFMLVIILFPLLFLSFGVLSFVLEDNPWSCN